MYPDLFLILGLKWAKSNGVIVMRPSGIGGQAVIEGVMMRNKSEYAVAVRTPQKDIDGKKGVYVGISDRIRIFKSPILRGIAAFIDSMVLGMSTLMYSAEFYENEENAEAESSIKARRNKAMKEKKEKKEAIAMGITMTISILLVIAIFMLVPFLLAELLNGKIDSFVARNAIEGAIRLVIFILYIKAISLMKDIRRVFMYHGAEHKVINCVENGYELTVENARKQTKEHKRCGTSFLLYVVVISFIVFLFIQMDALWLRMLLRIVLIPVIAGIAYEFIKLAGRSNNVIVNILSRPGMWLQALTTKEPDDSMLEVAIASVDAVFDWKAYQDNKGRIRRRSTSAFETISLDDEDEDDDILKEFDKYLHDDEEKKDDNEES